MAVFGIEVGLTSLFQYPRIGPPKLNVMEKYLSSALENFLAGDIREVLKLLWAVIVLACGLYGLLWHFSTIV